MSEFQKRTYVEYAEELESFITVTRNGVDDDLILRSIEGVERNPNRLVYAARPERGLDYLLTEIWPRLYQANNKLELCISGYDVFGVHVSEETQQLYAMCKKLENSLPGITNVGALKKEDYYKLLASSALMIYPTNFPEISCINAMETMLCGTPMVTTNDFALKETCAKGSVLIEEPWGTPEYTRAFIFKTLGLLAESQNDSGETYKQLVSEGKEWVLDRYLWSDIADEWERIFCDTFDKRSSGNRLGVLKELIRNDDYVAARVFENRFPDAVSSDPDISQEIADVLDAANTPLDKDNVVDNELTTDEGEMITRYQLIIDKIVSESVSRKRKKISVLDIGCNHGQLTAGIVEGCMKVGIECNATGIDFHPDAIQRCRDRQTEKRPGYNGCSFSVHQFGKDPIDELGVYDFVVAGEIMEHMKDTDEFVSSLKALTEDDGWILITCPQGCWKPLVGEAFEVDPTLRGHVHHFEMNDIIDVFSNQLGYTLNYVPCGTNYANELVGNWVLFFQNNPEPIGSVDYTRKFLTTRPLQQISAAMIVRDNEDDLARCIKSFRHVVDQLVIVDTGSTDGTKEVAKKFTNEIYDMDWPDDFSVARNESLKYTKHDWVIWIDSDEVLVYPTRIHKYVNSSLYNGYVIRQNHLMLDFKAEPDVPVRLFRNHQDYQFYGVIHEHCEEKMDEPIAPAMVLPDADIAHYGYLTETDRRYKCANRNLALLAKDRKVNPKRRLTLVLLMRDHINISNWDIERAKGKTITEVAVKHLRACIQLFRDEIEEGERIYPLAEPLYQSALATLGRFGIAISEDVPNPPFESALTLAAAAGGLSMPPESSATPERRWFATIEDHKQYLRDKQQELFTALKASIKPTHRY
jgi:2-polyprenyl-3-methyl-5-hydroxy-6-metoxy-1,4-benzoquinol methylase